MKVVEYLVIEKGLKADALDCINESPLLLVMRKLSTTTEEINKKNLLSVLRFFVQQNYIDYNKIVSVDYKNASYLAFGLIYKLNIEILQLFFEKGARLKNEDITYFCRNFTRYLDETAVAFLESNSLFIFSGIGANERMTMIKELVDCGSQSDIERARRLGLDLTTPLSDGLSPKEFAIGRGKEFFIP